MVHFALTENTEHLSDGGWQNVAIEILVFKVTAIK